MSGEELAAEAQISAAKRRAVEVRAEAAMLVEAVEDRAYSVSACFHSSFVQELRCVHCISWACHAHGAMTNTHSWWCLLASLRGVPSAVTASHDLRGIL